MTVVRRQLVGCDEVGLIIARAVLQTGVSNARSVLYSFVTANAMQESCRAVVH